MYCLEHAATGVSNYLTSKWIMHKVQYLIDSFSFIFRRCFQTSQRSLKQILTKTLRIKHEDFYKRMDKIPLEYEMIYKFPLHYTINFGKAVALITTAGVPLAMLYYKLANVKNEVINFIGMTATSQDDAVYFLAGLIAFNIIIFRICHMIPLRIYRYQKS